MIYAIINIILIIVVKALYDSKQFAKGKGIAHSKEWCIVAVCSSPAIYLLGERNDFQTIAAALMCMGVIWFFFDGLLNKLRGKNWWYTGVKFSGSAKSDGFLQRFSPGIQKVIKIAALLIPVIIYLYSCYTNN